jgi:hypothetical protein
MGALFLLTMLVTTVWVGIDASQRDWTNNSFARSAIVWVFGVVVMWLIVFPVYLVARNKAPRRAR